MPNLRTLAFKTAATFAFKRQELQARRQFTPFRTLISFIQAIFRALVPHLLMLEARQYMSTLLIIILVLFLLGGGGWGYSRWRG